MDLKDAYCQLQLEESRDLVIINIHKGLFYYTRLPFGVVSAPVIFQREIDKILQGMKDDVLVYEKNEEEHSQNLNAVLTRLEKPGKRLHPNKCKFLKPSIEYLDYRIDHQGFHPME